MNKKILVILTAALLLLSATACHNRPGKTNETTNETDGAETTGSYLIVGTGDEDNTISSDNPSTKDPATETDKLFDPTEENPVFVDVTKQVVVVSAVATVRTSTRVEENNAVGWPVEGRLLDVNGESDNWYRITYNVNGEDKTCYIAKTVTADSTVLNTFTVIENGEEVEVIVDAVNVRSYPSTDSIHSIRGSLKKGAKVTRVAVNENWSRILYEVVSETETDEAGAPVVKIMQYYISNDCVKAVTNDVTTDVTNEVAPASEQ
jgi:hypothetical protein